MIKAEIIADAYIAYDIQIGPLIIPQNFNFGGKMKKPVNKLLIQFFKAGSIVECSSICCCSQNKFSENEIPNIINDINYDEKKFIKILSN